MFYLKIVPPDIAAIFSDFFATMNLSVMELSPMPARALSIEEKFLQALFRVLFPGRAS